MKRPMTILSVSTPQIIFGVPKSIRELADFLFSKLSSTGLSPDSVHDALVEYANGGTVVRRAPKSKKQTLIPPLVLIEKFGDTTCGLVGTQLTDERVIQTIDEFKTSNPNSKIKKNRPGDFGTSYSFSRATMDAFIAQFKDKCIDLKIVPSQIELYASTNPNDTFVAFCNDILKNIDSYPNVSRHTTITEQQKEIQKMWRKANPQKSESVESSDVSSQEI